jgi:tetratricopeptide (TPR) repeat protein
MALLKLSKRLIIVAFIFMLVSLINAQSEKPVSSAVLKAFKESYASETAGDYTKSINTLKSVYEKGSYELNLRLGWLSYNNKQYTESMDYYSKAIELMPYSIEAKFGYVLPAAAVEKWDEVKKQYEEILKIDGMNSIANYRLGMMYYYGKDYSKAYTFFERVVNSYPFDYNSTLMFAWTNYQLGKTREAEVLFTKVLEMSPDDTSATEGLGLLKK